MQHVSQLITVPSEKSGEQMKSGRSAPLMLSEEQMGQVWQRMAAMYGHRWTSNYGAEDDGTWRKGLAGLMPAQIGSGLVKCLERRPAAGEEDWPPTLNEFRGMCLPEKVPHYHREYISLPRPAQDPDAVKNAIADMRNALSNSFCHVPRSAPEQAATPGPEETDSATTGNVSGLPE